MYELAGGQLFIMYHLGSEMVRSLEQVARYSTLTFKSLECRKGFFGLSSGHNHTSSRLSLLGSAQRPPKKASSQHCTSPRSNYDLSWASKIPCSLQSFLLVSSIFLVGSIVHRKLQLGHDVRSDFGRSLSDTSALERCSQLENRSIIIYTSRCYLVSY
jgi:hypothetical protein